MNIGAYPFRNLENNTLFAFSSQGKNGVIIKIVTYQETGKMIDGNEVYNLAFGDYDSETGQLDDMAISDNGDMERVLATVAQTVILFFQHNPDIIVEAKGSTPARTRLYQMLITKYIAELFSFADIYGFNDEIDKFEVFAKGKKYSRFLARKK